MIVKDILNKKFSVLLNVDGYTYHQGLSDYTQTILSLKQIIELGNRYSEQIDILRSLEYHSDKQKEYKSHFPCWFTGGIFPLKQTRDKDILEYSNILAIDIDKCDNIDIDLNDIKHKLFELPYVFMISKSISGEGIYVLVLLEDGRYTTEYYEYLVKLWKHKFNVNIDEHCTNIGRKRFISYDNELLIKDDKIEIESWKLKYIEKKIETKKSEYIYAPKYDNNDSVGLTKKAIWYLLNNCNYSIDDINTNKAYSVWYHIGCDFRHFEDGEQMFIQFSNNTTKYRDSTDKILSKWNNTKIEKSIGDVCRKWCGICKNKLGKDWISIIKEKQLF